MKPLQSVAMGLVVIVLSAPFHGYDALPDPLGWVLVALGVGALPVDLTHRGNLLGLAALAGLVSAVLWVPSVHSGLEDADPSLAWSASLPQIAFTVLLCHALAALATGAGDTLATRWLTFTRTAAIAVGLLPVLVFGAGVDSLELTSYLAAGVVAVLLIWLLFTYAGRPWAGATVRKPSTATPPDS